MRKTILASLLLAISSTSFAAEEVQKIKGFYLGAGYGSFSYNTVQDWDDDYRYGDLIEHTDGNTIKVYSGYQFNRIIAVEATYTDYGDTQGYVYSILNNKQEVKQSPTSFSVAANAGYSFSNGLRPFGLLGLSYMSLNSTYAFLDTDNPIAIKSGFGLDYAPVQLKGVQLRVAYEMDSYFAEANTIRTENTNVDIFILSSFYAGISYKF
jgi:opacity protein-like surface antigen